MQTVKRANVRNLLDSFDQRLFRATFIRRTDLIVRGVVVQPAGSVRHMTCKRKPNLFPTVNWQSKGGSLPFDPVAKGLYHIYTVEGTRGNDGRGNHWGFIDLKTVIELKYRGRRIRVLDN